MASSHEADLGTCYAYASFEDFSTSHSIAFTVVSEEHVEFSFGCFINGFLLTGFPPSVTRPPFLIGGCLPAEEEPLKVDDCLMTPYSIKAHSCFGSGTSHGSGLEQRSQR